MDYIKKQLELKLKDIIEYVRKENINVWVAGGAITSLATNRDINDYDLYFKDTRVLANVTVNMVQAVLNDVTPEVNDTKTYNNAI